MDEYEEPSDVEMVPIEEIERTRATLKPEIQTLDINPERPMDSFTTGIDIFSKEEKLKMEERAKRFGLTEKCKELSNVEEEDLYSSMGIVDDGENTKNIRLNVIHMRGTEDMSTKDVFKFFQDYAPMSIEWINDVSCNVVWFDNVTAARAMLGLSKRILGSVAKYSDRENDSENRKDVVIADEETESIDADKNGRKEDCISIKDIDYPLPPGIWRKGINYPKSKGIFLRFGTRMDKKQGNAEKKSEYYKKYGNPNFGGIKGILTESRKRMYKQTKQNKRKSSIEDKNQDETKNPWGTLSETWGLNDVVEDDFLPKNGIKDQGRSIKERLGLKYPEKDTVQAEESGEASSSSDSDENWCKRSKIPRMRMHADDEEEKVQKRRAKLRFQMILSNLNKSGDLRSKLGKPKTKTQYHEPIQVVVTNMSATSSKRDNSGIIRQQGHQIVKEIQSSEREEGEWQESEDEDVHEEEEKEEQRYSQRGLMNAQEEREKGEEDEEEGEHKEDEEDSGEEDSDVPAKEIQGPKGSVIKVVPPKPRIASTVWARLNHVKSEASDSYLKKRPSSSRDLRSTLKSGDLRSRIGNHTRGRSPLRIEVKNDKYTKDGSDGE